MVSGMGIYLGKKKNNCFLFGKRLIAGISIVCARGEKVEFKVFSESV